MNRIVIRFKDGTHINTEADYIQRDEEFITAWNGDSISAIVRTELILTAYLSEKGERNG